MQFEDKLTYEKRECGICHFSWYYPKFNEEVLTPIEKLFYLQIDICPNCKYTSEDVTQIMDGEAELMKTKEYEELIKSKNAKYALVCHRESYICLAYAFLKEKLHQFGLAGKAYLVASEIETMQYETYLNSNLYNEKLDKEMIEESKKNVTKYIQKGLSNILVYAQQKSTLDIKDYLLISYAYVRNGEKENSLRYLSQAIKLKPTDDLIDIIQQINNMTKEL